MAIKKENTELEFLPPQSSGYIRSINTALRKQLQNEDTATLTVPTLLSRAKALVNKDRFIMLLTVKKDN